MQNAPKGATTLAVSRELAQMAVNHQWTDEGVRRIWVAVEKRLRHALTRKIGEGNPVLQQKRVDKDDLVQETFVNFWKATARDQRYLDNLTLGSDILMGLLVKCLYHQFYNVARKSKLVG